jgi:hypothetical protein
MKPLHSVQNPDYYRSFVGDLEWIEAMQEIVKPLDPGLLLMVHKYLERQGKKGPAVQDLAKAKFYLDFLLARMLARRDVKVDEVQYILKDHLERPTDEASPRSGLGRQMRELEPTHPDCAPSLYEKSDGMREGEIDIFAGGVGVGRSIMTEDINP